MIECKLLAVNDGTILITNKDRQSFVQIGFDNHHGEAFVGVHGKDAKQKTVLRSSEHKGHATTYAKDGIPFAKLGIDEHGGFVHLKAKGEGKVSIGIIESGNGAISTYDKHGIGNRGW